MAVLDIRTCAQVQGTSRTLELTEWRTPASDYAERQVGHYRLHKTEYPAGQYYPYGWIDGYLYYYTANSLPIMLLQEQREGMWKDWMSDGPCDYRRMQKYAEVAEGDVLVAGLGLGLFIHELAKNDRVGDVTVVERSPEVIGLILDSIKGCMPEHIIRIVQEDFWSYLLADNRDYGMVMVDVWSTSNSEEHSALYPEVGAAYELLKKQYPKAKIVIHGFSAFSDVQVAMPYFEARQKVKV